MMPYLILDSGYLIPDVIQTKIADKILLLSNFVALHKQIGKAMFCCCKSFIFVAETTGNEKNYFHHTSHVYVLLCHCSNADTGKHVDGTACGEILQRRGI
jgi:hypothetical protein